MCYKKFLNKKISQVNSAEIKRDFEIKLGMDISEYIFTYIEPTNYLKCIICDIKIKVNYFICYEENCKKQLCRKCYQITSKYNNYKPYCDIHFNNKKCVLIRHRIYRTLNLKNIN